ncbi:MAG: hypothetical protein EB127_18900 [Alphaproteobacteria bacterium]|nr:hypothetical protein [Alphaproteobacteria bacterium]
MENNKEWLKAVVDTYNNLNNQPAEETQEKVLNEECVECNESVDPDIVNEEEINVDEADDIEELEEEISDEDFLVTLLEDIQEKAEVELTEDEIDYILETVVNVVEGLVEAKKNKKW